MPIAALNLGDSTVPVVLAVVAADAGFAALLGYFMFYGRISDVYIGVITLTVSLILFELVNSTAGDDYHIGAAELGGFNGIPGVPPLNFPGDPSSPLDPEQTWYAAMGALIVVYALLRVHPGQPLRPRRRRRSARTKRAPMLLGYDPRLYKLLTFIIGGRRGGPGRLPVHQSGAASSAPPCSA